MTHLTDRLNERKINLNEKHLNYFAKNCRYDTALILVRGSHRGVNSGDYNSRKESNGDLIILIVRNKKPVTIMFRRSNQKMTPESMRVNSIIDISQEIAGLKL